MARSSATERGSDSELDEVTSNVTVETMTPNTDLESSPTLVEKEFNEEENEDDMQEKPTKKKKKKKSKSKAKNKANKAEAEQAPRPNVLCISRNKHWRYISSYHGPWLQLPVELLETLLTLNLDPATLTAPEPHSLTIEDSHRDYPSSPFSTSHSAPTLGGNNTTQRKRNGSYLPGLGVDSGLYDFSPPDSPRTTSVLQVGPSSNALPLPMPPPGKAMPPPIDPGVFRSVTSIRRLIDEASDLSVRASTGMTASELRAAGYGTGNGGGNPWATAQALGINPLGNNNGNGRNTAMSAMRVHRLRALAVQKLAQAYKQDEIASSVMVMQGGSVFDDIAERVLKTDPNDVDAKYVHFFHEKIPSRQLAESTTTEVLDQLIRQCPHRLEYHRTRGIVHCFREEFAQATKDFTFAIKEARAQRRAKMSHSERSNNADTSSRTRKARKKQSGVVGSSQSAPEGLSGLGADGNGDLPHPSALPDAPDPVEPQCMFFRGIAYLQQAVYLIEKTVLALEGVKKGVGLDGGEMRLSYIENGRYGGVEMGHPDGPLGAKDGKKVLAYREALCDPRVKDQVDTLLKKAIRDHEKFLSYFDMLETRSPHFDADIAEQAEIAFYASESIRGAQERTGKHSARSHHSNATFIDKIAIFSTYHPLLVEAHFSILIAKLMLADFKDILPTFVHAAAVVDGLEGYPVFLLPRSLAQAEFVEVLERLASGWKAGVQPHSLTRARSKEKRLAIEAPPLPTPPPLSAQTNAKLPVGLPTPGPSTPITPSTPTTSSGAYDPIIGDSAVDDLTPKFTPIEPRADAAIVLDCARILLAPVYARQKERAAAAASEKKRQQQQQGQGGKIKPLSINIPLHGPRVEVVLAWIGAVHLPELGS